MIQTTFHKIQWFIVLNILLLSNPNFIQHINTQQVTHLLRKTNAVDPSTLSSHTSKRSSIPPALPHKQKPRKKDRVPIIPRHPKKENNLFKSIRKTFNQINRNTTTQNNISDILGTIGSLLVGTISAFYPSWLFKASYPPSKLSTFQQEVFTQHNVYRAAAGLNLLTWDSDLAAFTRSYMESQEMLYDCEFEHSTYESRANVGNFKNVGENLYMSWGFVTNGYRVANKWFEEMNCYRYGPIGDSCTYFQNDKCEMDPIVVGHFTQMMWQHATHVGCDWLECGDCVGYNCPRTYVGCVYGSSHDDSGGNVLGDTPFTISVADRLGLPTCSTSTRDVRLNETEITSAKQKIGKPTTTGIYHDKKY